MYGAGAALQVLAGAMAIERETCLPLAGMSSPTRRIPWAPAAESQRLQSVLIASRGNGGINASLVLKRLDTRDT
jgi:hypothetical protein